MKKIFFTTVCASVLCFICGCSKSDDKTIEKIEENNSFIMKTPDMKVAITTIDTRGTETDEAFIYTVKEIECDGVIKDVDISYKIDVNYDSAGNMIINSFSEDGILMFGMKVDSDSGKIVEDNFYDITKADGCVNRKYQNLKAKLNNDFGFWWDLACAFGACGYIGVYVSATVLCATGSTKYDQ